MKIPYKFKRMVNNMVTVQKVYEQLSIQARLKLVHHIQSSYSFNNKSKNKNFNVNSNPIELNFIFKNRFVR